METSLKTGFAQIFYCYPKNLGCTKCFFFWGGGGSLQPPSPPSPPPKEGSSILTMTRALNREKYIVAEEHVVNAVSHIYENTVAAKLRKEERVKQTKD